MTDISNWKVVIVDDEPDNIEVVKVVLEFNDVTTWTALSGQEGLTLIEQHRPTMALIDIQMPGMSGVDLLRKIRSLEGGDELIAVALTAYSMQGDRERLLQEGFDGYISKPIDAMRLIDELMLITAARGHK